MEQFYNFIFNFLWRTILSSSTNWTYNSLIPLDERRVELKELAHKDGLTKLYNRYGFDEMAEKMISKIQKNIA